jgi:D-beta-D-heptose 7-phosphate kinase/D-beta-D-heptose 1-phosphate adenosyltransferase
VFVNGCFDILHPGHISLFKYAKSLGDIVLVAIDTDARVMSLKGRSRPINSLKERTIMLECIKYIDKVVSFDSDKSLEKIVKEYNPDIMVVGSEYKDKKVIASEFAKEVKYFEKIKGYSTTKTIKNISGGR